MRAAFLLTALAAVSGAALTAHAAEPTATEQSAAPQPEFLFIGSFHMSNPGRDVHNTHVDDVLSPKRQREIADVVRRIERYRPTKVMVEADAGSQDKINERFTASCHGTRPLERNEIEQFGFRIACDMGLTSVQAVDWNELGPIKDEDSIDYRQAVERHQQQAQFAAHMALGKAMSDRQQQLLDHGTVLEVLQYLNSDTFLKPNAMSYFRIGLLGTADDPIGANWVQLWFGRNVQIFNNIVRHTDPGDRVLVIYGAGHGNLQRQLASDSGMYRVQEPLAWLSAPEAMP